MVIIYELLTEKDRVDDIECLIGIEYIKSQTQNLCSVDWLYFQKKLRFNHKNYSPLFQTYYGKELQKYNCAYENLMVFQKVSCLKQLKMYCK